MEPPIGYGWTYRSIFPESQSERAAAPRFRGRSWSNNLIDTSARPAALEAISGLHRHKVCTIKAFPVTALLQIIRGTGIRGTEKL